MRAARRRRYNCDNNTTAYGPRYGGGAGTGIRSGRSSKQSKAKAQQISRYYKRFVDAIRYRDLGAAAYMGVLLHLTRLEQRRPVHGDRIR